MTDPTPLGTKVLVLGGSGYVGRTLISRFQKDVQACVDYDLVHPEEKQCPYIQGDIRDFSHLDSAIRGLQPDLVVNSTAAVPLIDSEETFDSTNVLGVRNTLEACLRHKVKKVLHISTCGIYGVPPVVPILEDTPPSPADGYGRSKVKGEAVVREYLTKGLDISIVRPRSMIGFKRLGIFHVPFELIRCGKSMFTFGAGSNRIQFLHVQDFAEGCLRVCRRRGPEVFNFGAERYQTIRQDLTDLAAYAKTGSRIRAIPRPVAVGLLDLLYRAGLSPIVPYQFRLYGSDIFFDVAKAAKELDWHPAYSNTDMLRESYDWYRVNWDRENRDHSVQARPLKLGILNLVKLLPF